MDATQLPSSKNYNEDQIYFKGMGCPCEILIRVYGDQPLPADVRHQLLQLGMSEVTRLEARYSRYQSNSFLSEINRGNTVVLDQETLYLLHLADTCYELSDGLFDITSGILRRHWSFYGQDIVIPNQDTLKQSCDQIGWQKVEWQTGSLTLPKEMEIDLGGIVKEYAVDRVIQLMSHWCDLHLPQLNVGLLVNLGGDLRVHTPQALVASGLSKPWLVSLEQGKQETPTRPLKASNQAVATSGTTHRYAVIDGQQYGHILNPKTGMPIEHQPTQVSVFSENTVQAGMLASIAMMKGKEAQEFLNASGCEYRVIN